MDRSAGEQPTAAIEQEVEELYERESSAILRYARALTEDREMAHDALQEAFFRFFLCRSGGQQIRSPRGWLFRVARNYVLDQKKAGSWREVAVESLADLPCPIHFGAVDEGSYLMQELPRIGLSAREIECVRLRAEDLQYEEIAMILGLQSGTIGALLARAHEKIRKAMGRPRLKRNKYPIPATPVKHYAS
jgi:RNA polymerase sigma factor (sigma-70 family)